MGIESGSTSIGWRQNLTAPTPTDIAILRRTDPFRCVPLDRLTLLIENAVAGSVPKGETLIDHASSFERDPSVYVVLQGRVEIRPAGSKYICREAPVTIGEIVALCPELPRTADVVAATELRVLQICASRFRALAEESAVMACELARMMALRLAQRNGQLQPPNPIPKIFIASSSEARSSVVALRDALTTKLGNKAEVRLWDQEFPPGKTTIESIERVATSFDFAVALLTTDDQAQKRMKTVWLPRDNVIFEMGMFFSGCQATLKLTHPRQQN